MEVLYLRTPTSTYSCTYEYPLTVLVLVLYQVPPYLRTRTVLLSQVQTTPVNNGNSITFYHFIFQH